MVSDATINTLSPVVGVLCLAGRPLSRISGDVEDLIESVMVVNFGLVLKSDKADGIASLGN